MRKLAIVLSVSALALAACSEKARQETGEAGGAVASDDARHEAQRALAAGEGMEPEALPPVGVTAAAVGGIETKGARA